MGLSLRNIGRKITDLFDANTQADQQRRMAAGQPQFYQQQQAQKLVQQQAAPDNRNLFSKVYDQVNPLDNNRTFQNAAPTNIRSNIAQLTHNGATNLVGDLTVKPFVTNPIATAIVEPARNLAAEITHNRAAIAASNARQAQNVDNSIPGYFTNIGKNVGGAVGDIGAATYADLTNQSDLGTSLRDEAIRKLNATPIGQVANMPQKWIANAGIKAQNKNLSTDQQNQLVNENLSSIGIDPKASLGKQLTDTASGALQLYGLAEGVKKGGEQISAFKEGKAPLTPEDIAVQNRLNERPANLKTIEQSTTNMSDAQRLQLAGGDTGQAGLMSAEPGTRRFNAATGKVETIPPTTEQLSKTAVNSFENSPTGIKPGGLQRAAGEIDNATAKPVEYRVTPEGKTTIVDGRHRLEAARAAGISDFPSVDITDQFSSTGRPRVEGKGTGLPKAELPQGTQRMGVEKVQPQANNTLTDRYFNAKEYVAQQNKLSKQAAQSGEKGKLGRAVQNIKTATIDALNPIEAPVNKALGFKNETTLRLRNQLDRSLRGRQLAGAFARDNGLNDIIQSVPDVKTFDQYVIAKHAIDLEKNGIKTGRNLAADRNLIQAVGQKYEPHAQALTEYNHKLLDRAVQDGLISSDTSAYLKQKYPNYVPFERIFTDEELNQPRGTGAGPASLSTQTVVQRIKGSERQIQSPLESIAAKTNDVITQGERNKAARTVIETHGKAGLADNFRELSPEENIGTKSTISYLDNGVKRTFETLPEIAKAAKSLNPVQRGMWGKIFSYPTRVLRLGATGANASFALANVVKDIGSGIINSDHPAQASLANPKVFMQALDAAVHHGGEKYGELVREGAGGTSFDIGRDSAKVSVGKIRAGKSAATTALYTAKHPGELLRAFEDTIGRSEEFGRAVQYFGNKEAALREGKAPELARAYAADAARNNTVNFARAGDYGRVVNSAIPYLNAGVQGSRTLLRNLKDKPMQTGAKIALTAFIPVATATAWNLNDPKRKEAYDNISEYEKQNNIIIVPPNPKQDTAGRWNVIKIPVSQEIANLNNIVRNGVEARAKDKNFDFAKMAGDLVGTTTSINAQSPSQAVGQLTPQIAKVPVETITNKNLFTGQQIVPDAIKNLSPQDQANKNTSGTAKTLGKAFGMSPLQIDNAIRTSTGGLGQNLINTSDRALAAAGVIKKEEVKGKSLGTSIANRFNSAQGLTPGAQYFNTIQDQSKKQKLAGRDYETLQAILAKEIDSSGNPIKQNDQDTLFRNRALASNPNVAKVLSDSAKALNAKTGKPIDPIYQLSPQQQNTYYKLQATPYKSDDYNKIARDNKDWLQPFQNSRADFFQSNPIVGAAATDKVPYPKFTPATQSNLDNYFLETDPAKKSTMIKSNPQIKNALQAIGQYTNDKRVAQGYSPFKDYPTAPKELDAFMAVPKGSRSSWIRSNPDAYSKVQDFFAQSAAYELANNAGNAKYQGENLNQKALKAAYSLGQYDIAKDASGNYSINPAAAYAARSNSGSRGYKSYSKNRISLKSSSFKTAKFGKKTATVKASSGKGRRAVASSRSTGSKSGTSSKPTVTLKKSLV